MLEILVAIGAMALLLLAIVWIGNRNRRQGDAVVEPKPKPPRRKPTVRGKSVRNKKR